MICQDLSGTPWLLIEDNPTNRWLCGSVWFNLETGEIREMFNNSKLLIRYGWNEFGT